MLPELPETSGVPFQQAVETARNKEPQCFKEVPLVFFEEILLQVEVIMDWALTEALHCCPLLKQMSKAFTMCLGGYQAFESQVFARFFFHNFPEMMCAAGLISPHAWPNQSPPRM